MCNNDSNAGKRDRKRIAYSGIEGSFAAIATGRIFPDEEKKACHTFREAYEKVVSRECDAAVLPIENSYAGEVGQVTDLMFGGDLVVCGIYELSIVQCLLGISTGSLEEIRTVISHPQALEQCAEYVASHGWETIPFENTARAAREVARRNDPVVAAIASAETADLYGLTVLASDINESAQNKTRFAVFVRKEDSDAMKRSGTESSSDEAGSDGINTLLLFTIKHVAGSLARAVSIIGQHGYNMRVIRSRPVKNVNWQYYFYTELEGRLDNQEGQAMLQELGTACELIRIAGNYLEGERI